MTVNLFPKEANMDSVIAKVKKSVEGSGIGFFANAKIEDIAQLTVKSKWYESRIWFSYATQLDNSQLYYFLPDRFQALWRLTGEYYDYAAVNIGDIQLFIMGHCDKKQPFAPFWTPIMTKNLTRYLPNLSVPALHELRFALSMEQDFENRGNYHHVLNFEEAWDECRRYQMTHRKYVVAIGDALGISMQSHDLTKTRLVECALAYLWHWRSGNGPHQSTLYNIALDVVKHCHTELESHHPQFGEGLNTDEMFVDRIAVRIQKQSPVLDANGFDLEDKYIPENCKEAWKRFKTEHSHHNLYKIFDPEKIWYEDLSDDDVSIHSNQSDDSDHSDME